VPAVDADLPEGRGRPPSGPRRRSALPERSALARPSTVLRIFSRRRWFGRRRQPPDRVDRAGIQAATAVRGVRTKLPLDRSVCGDLETATGREWLETNGLEV